jgi:GT2 family glycosyltransferase
MPHPTLSVVIVNWNGRDDLVSCLQSLGDQDDRQFETILVDNGSGDGSVEMVRVRFPWVCLVETGGNLGFAAAANIGIDASQGEWVATLNNDAVAAREWVARLRSAAAEAGPSVGSLQSRILFRHDRARTNSTGLLLFDDGFALDRDFDAASRTDDEAAPIFCASAGAALYRRAMLEQVRLPSGYFDRRFFMYFEDVDLGWRCRLAGWDAVYEPRAVVVHAWQASASRRGRWFVKVHTKRNHILTLVKNASRPFLARALLVTGLDWLRIPALGGPGALIGLLRKLPGARAERALVSAMCRVPRREVEGRWALPANDRK